ncbi:DUF3179 domain-containing (seleno)protein [Streptomyces flavidovirens]|uniref:DUF3179 domain-containing (seleno)protein n=1 Tax=Streptomyces flavidovirens TaxID=67298 RepID=UPI0034336D90
MWGWQAISDRPAESPPAVQPGQNPSLETLAGAAVSGGPGKDGIPSVDRSKFVPAGDADFLRHDEPVFGLEYRGEFRAYPPTAGAGVARDRQRHCGRRAAGGHVLPAHRHGDRLLQPARHA